MPPADPADADTPAHPDPAGAGDGAGTPGEGKAYRKADGTPLTDGDVEDAAKRAWEASNRPVTRPET